MGPNVQKCVFVALLGSYIIRLGPSCFPPILSPISIYIVHIQYGRNQISIRENGEVSADVAADAAADAA